MHSYFAKAPPVILLCTARLGQIYRMTRLTITVLYIWITLQYTKIPCNDLELTVWNVAYSKSQGLQSCRSVTPWSCSEVEVYHAVALRGLLTIVEWLKRKHYAIHGWTIPHQGDVRRSRQRRRSDVGWVALTGSDDVTGWRRQRHRPQYRSNHRHAMSDVDELIGQRHWSEMMTVTSQQNRWPVQGLRVTTKMT